MLFPRFRLSVGTKVFRDPDLLERVTDDRFTPSPQPAGERPEDIPLIEVVAGLQQEIRGYWQEISNLRALRQEEGTLVASPHGNRTELEVAEEALRQAREEYGPEIAELQRRCGHLVQETEMCRLRIQAIEPQQAQTAHGEIISLRSEVQGLSAKVQETERSLERSELSRASLEHRLVDSNAWLSTTLQNFGQARETISALECQVIEQVEITRRAELDCDSARTGLTSLREQVRFLEDAKDQETRRFEQEIDGLRLQIEEYVVSEGKLLDRISGLESTLYEARVKLSVAEEDALQLTTSLAMSQVAREGFLAQIASLESSRTQHLTESAQELSNLQNAHALCPAEK